MSYSEITFNDKNWIKRWLQRQRLITAKKCFAARAGVAEAICDFGAGNGELCKLLAAEHPSAKIFCYEPSPDLLTEARQNLAGFSGIEFLSSIRAIEPGSLDAVFCLEVFEHLPHQEMVDALDSIYALLKPGGLAIIGVPVEIGLPALYKGMFRMSRRFGAFDANIKNIALSVLGCPPKNRPMSEIAPGLRFYCEHTGFDFRRLRDMLEKNYSIKKTLASPISFSGPRLMPEIYFLVEKRNFNSQ